MIRLTPILVLACFALACRRGQEQAVTVMPGPADDHSTAVPADPFGSSSPAYEKLRETTDAALGQVWSGELEDFAPWLEDQTVAVERAQALLKALRVGPRDVYAVANGRIALVYEHIAVSLTEASEVARAEGHDADWTGQQARVWEKANGFWARCARLSSTGGTHLDAWDLRCRHGEAVSHTKLAP